MGHDVFRPRTAAREEKRQANEALGRSFCKTLAEPITISDSSAKRKHGIPQASGLVDLMFGVPKGTQLDTSALRANLVGSRSKRVIVVEVVTAKSSGRPVGEVVIVDQAEGMSAHDLKVALSDIAGDRSDLASGVVGRNLFGRGLSDVMRAHHHAVVQTYNGKQLTIARGDWRTDGWTIEMDFESPPSKASFRHTYLDPTGSGTAVRFVIADRTRCHIPDPGDIVYRLANFYMLRLIAADPNVDLVLRQHRAVGPSQDHIKYDFPVGQVVESFERRFAPKEVGLPVAPLKVEFLVVRTDSERGLRGPGPDRDGRENGMLVVDELDAVYDLTFGDLDYEKADFLSRIYGIIRVNGLRAVLESYLNADAPTSPLRPDRDGFNRDHEFSKKLLDFLSDHLRPIYEKERKLVEAKKQGALSAETKKRIDDALKQLNRYFQRVTDLGGDGKGTDEKDVPEPTQEVLFVPQRTKLIAGHGRHVVLLVREDVIPDGAECVTTASEGIAVQPETERIDKSECPRWRPHKRFFALRFVVTSSVVRQTGQVIAMLEGKNGALLEATLEIDDVMDEPTIEVPETMQFRPEVATGRPGRRNNLVLYVNPKSIPGGHYLRFAMTRRTGDISLVDPSGTRCDHFDIKLDAAQHQVKGQMVFRLLVPWSGTSWNQHAHVMASAKVGGPKPLTADAVIRLDEPEDAGFFKDVKYGEIDPKAPSQFAAGVITVNIHDTLNRQIFGDSKDEFDRRLTARPEAQQRLAALLLEEASFRALQQRYDENKLLLAERREIAAVHEEIDNYKYESAVDVYKALLRNCWFYERAG